MRLTFTKSTAQDKKQREKAASHKYDKTHDEFHRGFSYVALIKPALCPYGDNAKPSAFIFLFL